jgi:hypothetical protein
LKLFILQTLVLFILFLICIFGISLFSSNLIRRDAVIGIDKECESVIFGHSHSECAYNDSLIKNFKNLALSGDSYFYSFYRTKLVLSQNLNIKTVFIEFTNNQIAKSMDEWIFGKEGFERKTAFPEISSFLSNTDTYWLFSKSPIEFINSFALSLNIKLSRLYTGNYNFNNAIGGYNFLVRNKTDSLVANAQSENQIIENAAVETSVYNLKYLRLMIDFCKEKGTKVILVRSPVHKLWGSLKNEKQYQVIRQLNFRDCEFIDFADFPLKNSEFGDLSHLNYKGARKFSFWFNQLLENELLNKSNKQAYIDAEIKKLTEAK